LSFDRKVAEMPRSVAERHEEIGGIIGELGKSRRHTVQTFGYYNETGVRVSSSGYLVSGSGYGWLSEGPKKSLTRDGDRDLLSVNIPKQAFAEPPGTVIAYIRVSVATERPQGQPGQCVAPSSVLRVDDNTMSRGWYPIEFEDGTSDDESEILAVAVDQGSVAALKLVALDSVEVRAIVMTSITSAGVKFSAPTPLTKCSNASLLGKDGATTGWQSTAYLRGRDGGPVALTAGEDVIVVNVKPSVIGGFVSHARDMSRKMLKLGITAGVLKATACLVNEGLLPGPIGALFTRACEDDPARRLSVFSHRYGYIVVRVYTWEQMYGGTLIDVAGGHIVRGLSAGVGDGYWDHFWDRGGTCHLICDTPPCDIQCTLYVHIENDSLSILLMHEPSQGGYSSTVLRHDNLPTATHNSGGTLDVVSTGIVFSSFSDWEYASVVYDTTHLVWGGDTAPMEE